MFYLVGIGLGDVEDITVRGLNIVKKCSRVYLEIYTSMLTVGKSKLEEFYGRKLLLADRQLVEENANEILSGAKESDVALLIVGDPFTATTHADIILRAKKENIPFQIVHNTSIITAVGCCGLQLYSFGETVSIPFWTETWKPDSFYNRIIGNRERGLHTLCLLDIKVNEPTLESLTKKQRVYMAPKLMTVNEAAGQLLEILNNRREAGESLPDSSYNADTKCVGLANVGSMYQKVIYCTLKEMTTADLGDPLHSLIIPGNIHPMEEEFLSEFTKC